MTIDPQANTGKAASEAANTVPASTSLGAWVNSTPWGRLISCAPKSLAGALLLVALDVGFYGSFLVSFLVCPIWFLVSVVKNAIQRPGWGIALFRVATAALTLGLVLGNDTLQRRIGRANADRVVNACQQFHADTGKYPHKLDDLVPEYLPSVPRAKYCLMWGEFMYFDLQETHMLVWCIVPPHYRAIYHFEKGSWGHLD